MKGDIIKCPWCCVKEPLCYACRHTGYIWAYDEDVKGWIYKKRNKKTKKKVKKIDETN